MLPRFYHFWHGSFPLKQIKRRDSASSLALVDVCNGNIHGSGDRFHHIELLNNFDRYSDKLTITFREKLFDLSAA